MDFLFYAFYRMAKRHYSLRSAPIVGATILFWFGAGFLYLFILTQCHIVYKGYTDTNVVNFSIVLLAIITYIYIKIRIKRITEKYDKRNIPFWKLAVIGLGFDVGCVWSLLWT